MRRGARTAVIDLLHILPARNPERTADDREAVFVSIQRGAALASKASITSPEQGAQQECNSSLLCPPGRISFWRWVMVGSWAI
jgi:hypothetical protein